MKNLRLNFWLFSLLTMITVTLCLTSCGKENVEQVQEEVDEVAAYGDLNLLIPNLEEDADIDAILENGTDEELTKYQNDYIIYNYLAEHNLLEEVVEGTHEDFSFENAIEKLSPEQQSELNTQLVSVYDRYCAYYYERICISGYTSTCKNWEGILYACNWKTRCYTTELLICW